jgi:Domain of unknown function (DUF1905)
MRDDRIANRLPPAPMTATTYIVRGQVWLHPGAAGWHFVTLPTETADEIRARFAGAHRPFGSLPVRAALGGSSWKTSLFADAKSSSYLLPIKAETRRDQHIEAGDAVTLTIELNP